MLYFEKMPHFYVCPKTRHYLCYFDLKELIAEIRKIQLRRQKRNKESSDWGPLLRFPVCISAIIIEYRIKVPQK